MGKSTINGHFNSYVKLPEGTNRAGGFVFKAPSPLHQHIGASCPNLSSWTQLDFLNSI